MQPHANERPSGSRFALRDFVFVMRKGEVDPAGMNIEGIAEILHRHGGALDVPAWTAGADARFPEVFAGFGCFPESEIARIFLVILIDVHARAGLNAAQIDFRKFAILREFGNAEVNGAVTIIGKALLL